MGGNRWTENDPTLITVITTGFVVISNFIFFLVFCIFHFIQLTCFVIVRLKHIKQNTLLHQIIHFYFDSFTKGHLQDLIPISLTFTDFIKISFISIDMHLFTTHDEVHIFITHCAYAE